MLRPGHYISQLLVSKRDDSIMWGSLLRTNVLQATQIKTQMKHILLLRKLYKTHPAGKTHKVA